MSQSQLPYGMLTFAELDHALNTIPDQTDGDSCAVSQIGEHYVEFLSVHIARPGDEKLVEQFVVSDMVRQLNSYFRDRSGTTYWRTRLETEIKPYDVVVRFDRNGPDLDFVTDQRCLKDKNWVRIAAYCRLVRARFPTMLVDNKKSEAA